MLYYTCTELFLAKDSLLRPDYSAVVNSVFVLSHLCVVVVAELGEEQELDLSPRRKHRALGPPARGLSGVWLPGQR